MSSISGTVYSTLSALNTYSVAIDVTSTNIANAESTGYSRQTAIIKEKVNGNGAGCGVDVSKIERAYNSFLMVQLRNANQELGKSSIELEVLSSIEQVFSETDGSGLDAAMSSFWNAWQEVVNDPSGPTARSVMLSAAESLADTFNSMDSELSEISTGVEKSIDDTLTKINSLVGQIQEANKNLFNLKVSGQSTNACSDTLDSLVLELASLADIEVSTNNLGQVSVQLKNGGTAVYLVDASTSKNEGGVAWTLDRLTSNTQEITRVDNTGTQTNETLSISSGELGGYLDMRERVAAYQSKLDKLAGEIIDQVNTLHRSGYDLNGANNSVDFFSGTDAGSIAVNTTIAADPRLIAAASATGGTGDGSVAAAIAKLQSNTTFTNLGNLTFSDYYNAIVSGIGSEVESAETTNDTNSATQMYYTNACLSVSGVSTDEEMAKLVLYQNAYDSAAKIMTVLDEMLQTLIRM